MFCLRPWITEVDIETIYFTWRNYLFNANDIKEITLALSRSASKIFVLRNRITPICTSNPTKLASGYASDHTRNKASPCTKLRI